jgi:branched-chain amino acid transport system permease protein
MSFRPALSLLAWLGALASCWALDWLVNETLDPYAITVLIYAGINAILAVSLNLVTGIAGQFSLGHAGFMAVGGYTAALVSAALLRHAAAGGLTASLILLPSLLAGGLAASLAGYAVGLPSLRLRGDYLAIVTLGFGEIIRVLILNVDAVGGARGLNGIAELTNFGWVYSAAVTAVFVVWRFTRSARGRACLAVREDEIAAAAMGVNTTRAKTSAFVIGAFFAGVSGGLFAHELRYLNPTTFDFSRSFEALIMVVLGGLGSITGSVLAAALLTGAREGLRELQELTRIDFRSIVYAVLLIALMLARPRGLMGRKEVTELFGRKPRGEG